LGVGGKATPSASPSSKVFAQKASESWELGRSLTQLASLSEIILFLVAKFPVKVLNLAIFVLVKADIDESTPDSRESESMIFTDES
jgi:hypothetical protein